MMVGLKDLCILNERLLKEQDFDPDIKKYAECLKMVIIDWKKIITYAGTIIVPLALGGIVGFIISGSMDYESLKKPVLAPPPAVFPVVWTILYLLMGVSYGILKSNELLNFDISSVYYSQLAVNLLWPIFFFILKWRLFAFIWIVVLAILATVMAVRFYEKNKTAGLLQVPYVLWTVFASYLNLFVYILN